ncbi:MAG: helix-turn-helix domain-containing protein [Acetatifactor sp.]
MEQQKVGSFLKELRKEKNLTQEQLAEQFNVSVRTVSRWETAVNMPDIVLLVELAAFYDVSIPEIIDGERKSEQMKDEKMKDEIKEAAIKLSDYSESMNQDTMKSIVCFMVIAFIGMAAYVLIQELGLDTPDSIYEGIAFAGLGLGFGFLIVMIVYFSVNLRNKKSGRMMRKE